MTDIGVSHESLMTDISVSHESLMTDISVSHESLMTDISVSHESLMTDIGVSHESLMTDITVPCKTGFLRAEPLGEGVTDDATRGRRQGKAFPLFIFSIHNFLKNY